MLLQIVEGLMFMHGKGIMHRDVSANNVLISRIDGEKLYIVSDGIVFILKCSLE